MDHHPPRPSSLSWRTETALFGSGFFSLSQQPTLSVLVPLWALQLHATAVQIGIATAAVSILPFFYAVPVGALVDRMGSRRMLFVGSVGAAVLYALFPWFPDIWGVVAIQFFVGLFQAINWQAAQSYATKTGSDAIRASLMARFGFSSNLGTFVGPLLAGFLANQSYQWAFLGMAVWALMLGGSAYFLEPDAGIEPEPWSAQLLLPRMDDFGKAFRLMHNPAVILVMAVTFIRLGMYGMRQSFYPVLLHRFGYDPSQIGIFIAVGAVASSVSAATVGMAARYVTEDRLMLGGLALGVICQGLVPASGSYAVQMILNFGAGWAIGLTLPLMLTVLSRATPPEDRGLSIGLRNGMNRLASTTIPLGLGVLVATTGLGPAFYVVAALLLVGVGWTVRYRRRTTALPAADQVTMS